MASWDDARRETMKRVREVRDYDESELVKDYSALLSRLADEEVRAQPPKMRAFSMQQEFPRLALAYSGLFGVACHRDTPPPLEAVMALREVGRASQRGDVQDAKAKGMVMDIAETLRRTRVKATSPSVGGTCRGEGSDC